MADILSKEEIDNLLEEVDKEPEHFAIERRIAENVRLRDRINNEIVEDTEKLYKLGYVWHRSDAPNKTIEVTNLEIVNKIKELKK